MKKKQLTTKQLNKLINEYIKNIIKCPHCEGTGITFKTANKMFKKKVKYGTKPYHSYATFG